MIILVWPGRSTRVVRGRARDLRVVAMPMSAARPKNTTMASITCQNEFASQGSTWLPNQPTSCGEQAFALHLAVPNSVWRPAPMASSPTSPRPDAHATSALRE